MSFDTAAGIIQREMECVSRSGRFEGVDFHFMGGEPLLNFELIRAVCHFAWGKNYERPFHFYLITNGTLLDASERAWLESHRGRITVELSIDGSDSMQRLNRGCSAGELPLEWVRRCWPGTRFRMTVSPRTLSGFAKAVIALTADGYDLQAVPAMGVRWSAADAAAYADQWREIADFYSAHPGERVWKQLLKSIDPLFDADCVQDKCCGSGDSAVTYDVDGEIYPCVMFTPLVSGRDMRGMLAEVCFENPDLFADAGCADCFVRNMCKTCYGLNLLERGKLSRRDRSMCPLYRAEMTTICSFQRGLLERISDRPLSERESERLQRAREGCARLACD